MAVANKIRLFKIASEINIGKDTIVDFLQSKGFDIQNKPTATLDEAMVEAVHEKFKREIRATEVQREKLQKHRVVVKPPVKTTDEDIVHEEQISTKEITQKTLVSEVVEAKSAPVQKPSVSEKVKKEVPVQIKKDAKVEKETIVEKDAKVEKETIVEKDAKVEKEIIVEKTDTLQKEAKVEEIKAEPQIKEKKVEQVQAAKVPEKVEHTKITESKKKEQIIEAPKVAVQNVEKPTKIEVEKKETPKEEAKPFKAVQKPETEKRIEKRTPKETKPIIQKQSDTKSKLQKVNKTIETKRVPGESTEPTYEKKPSEQQKRDDFDSQSGRKRKKKRRNNIIEVKPGEKPQLRGLTVLGKIEMKKPTSQEKTLILRKSEEQLTDFEKAQIAARRKKKITTEPTKLKKVTKDITADDADAKGSKLLDKRKKKRKKTIREMISEKDLDKAIRQTISGIDDAHQGTLRNKLRQKKKAEREEKEIKAQEQQLRDSKTLHLTEFVTTADLANMMGIPTSDVIVKCLNLGLMVTINQRLDKDTLLLIADDYGFDVEFFDEKQLYAVEDIDDPDEVLEWRPPIVTIMGHVDHGKTSLLDQIRKSNVVSGEAGGITQHIGAYKVKMPGNKSITFLDTPGHEAFTAMRARGAQVTDIVVLVVAADDSVMPQTIEAISHSLAAKVPIIVAVNKVDKADSNPDRIRQQLADHKILVEEWGGKYQSVEISAKFGKNIDQLLEKILLEAELLELKANPERKALGVIVESNMNKGLGPVATIIVQKGSLRVGDPFVSGMFSGKVRAMQDERGDKIEVARPSEPVLVTGFDGLPDAGDTFISTSSEIEARNIANERKQLKREQDIRRTKKITLDDFSAQIQSGSVKELNLVLKGDVTGSIEALSDSLLKLSDTEVRVNILHKGVGSITETDVMLASASNAVVIGFNVNPTGSARKAAEAESIDVRLYNIIYDCINEIQLALEGLLAPELKEETIATIEVRKVFKISRIGSIAGCYVLSGKIHRNDKVRVLRNGLEIFKGSIESLKRGKDDVKEVDAKFECGIQLSGFNDIQENDIIEAYKIVEIKRTLR